MSKNKPNKQGSVAAAAEPEVTQQPEQAVGEQVAPAVDPEEEKRLAIKARIKKAEKRVLETQQEAQAAKRDEEAARAELDALKAEEIKKYKMSDADINCKYLAAQMKAREEQGQANALNTKILLEAGLLTREQVSQLGLGVSAADKAQARKVTTARAQLVREGKAFK